MGRTIDVRFPSGDFGNRHFSFRALGVDAAVFVVFVFGWGGSGFSDFRI